MCILTCTSAMWHMHCVTCTVTHALCHMHCVTCTVTHALWHTHCRHIFSPRYMYEHTYTLAHIHTTSHTYNVRHVLLIQSWVIQLLCDLPCIIRCLTNPRFIYPTKNTGNQSAHINERWLYNNYHWANLQWCIMGNIILYIIISVVHSLVPSGIWDDYESTT